MIVVYPIEAGHGPLQPSSSWEPAGGVWPVGLRADRAGASGIFRHELPRWGDGWPPFTVSYLSVGAAFLDDHELTAGRSPIF